MHEHSTIFSVKELKLKIKKAFVTGIPNLEQKISIIENWQENIISGKYLNANEQEIKSLFLTKFFGDVLGYEYNNPTNWNLRFELKTNTDSTKADAALGFFKYNNGIELENDVRAVIEIKDAKTTLDKPQNRKDFKGTSVEQAFMYAAKTGEKCKWVIVSNFLEIRLYLSSDMTKYERFDIMSLTDNSEFSKFYYLLAFGQLFYENIASSIDNFLLSRQEKEKEIKKDFYRDYQSLRELFFYHLKTHNPSVKPLLLLEYAQTIIDRIVFISVIKDYELINSNVLAIVDRIADEAFTDDNQELWRQLKNLFKSLDQGLPQRLYKFNGGLFRQNKQIDDLKINKVFLKKLLSLNKYDFESDLNVNILGHIFEQSITDIELLRKDIIENKKIEYIETEEEISLKYPKNETNRRKTSGIYYTPDNFTKYIVKNTLGTWLDEQKSKIGFDNLADQPANEQEKILHIKCWESYIEAIRKVKILDPACGSGAFLTQTFDFLFQERQIATDVLNKMKGEKIQTKAGGIFSSEPSKNILLYSQIKKEIVNNNLFGVDLNSESVEITKLGLWLKSASKNDALASLDNNIKCGNSLISDKNITDKAFNWEDEFKEIIQSGGFDVIVGNPPYVESKRLKEYSEYFSQNYTCYAGTADLYVYFFDLAFKLLKKAGYLGFINSNKFMKTGYGENLRKLLSEKNIKEILDFTDYRVFEDALVASAILIIKNSEPENDIRISLVKQSLDTYSSLEDYVNENQFFTKSLNLNKEIWFLSANGKLPLKLKIELNSKRLKDIEGIAIYRGVTTGYNDAFIIDQTAKEHLIKEDEKNAEIIKPLLQGRNIRKWFYNQSGKYMIFIPWHFPLHKDTTLSGASEKAEFELKNKYKSLYKHLLKHREKLLKRNADETGIRYEWYALQRCASTYYPEFEKEKIIWGLTADKWAYCFDDKKHYLPSNGYILTSNSQLSIKYILAVLNSNLMRFYFDFIGVMTAGGAYTLKYDTVAQFPIKVISTEQQQQIIEAVDEMIVLHKEKANSYQKFLNRITSNLSGFKENQKISNFIKISFSVLLEELKKQNINLTLKQQDMWEEYFNESKQNIATISRKIEKVEKDINSIVYKLFDINETEIEIIENL